MPQMDPNMNIINQVPLSQFIPNSGNMPLNQNIPMPIPIQDNNKQQSENCILIVRSNW